MTSLKKEGSQTWEHVHRLFSETLGVRLILENRIFQICEETSTTKYPPGAGVVLNIKHIGAAKTIECLHYVGEVMSINN
jgi:hypothetical protein